MTHPPAVFLVFQYTLLNKFHRLEDTLVVFLWCQQFKRLLTGNLDVDAHTVGITPSFSHQFLTGTGDGFQVDIAIEAMDGAQVADNGRQSLHRVVGIAHDTA